jgi:hypothetical protein
MNANWYALRLEPGRIVASPINSDMDAESLLAAEPILLGRPLDVLRLAQRQEKALVVLGSTLPDDVPQRRANPPVRYRQEPAGEAVAHAAHLELAVA